MTHRPPSGDMDTSKLRAAITSVVAGSSGGRVAAPECVQGELLKAISDKLDQVLERLAHGDTAIALLDHRVNALERIVYGLCGVILLAVVGGLVALVVKAGH